MVLSISLTLVLFLGFAITYSFAALVSVDCTQANNVCSTIVINGDPYSNTTLFHGYADPSIRHDPLTSVLYLAYSFPKVYNRGVPYVELHLSNSTDKGVTFNYMGSLWSGQLQSFNIPNIYPTCITSAEVINILPVASGATTRWYSAHLAYLVPDVISPDIYSQIGLTNYISLTTVSSTSQLLTLSSLPEARLGFNSTNDAAMGITQSLSDTIPFMAHCQVGNEPALIYSVVNSINTLYLSVQCLTGFWNSLDPNRPLFIASDFFFVLLSADVTSNNAPSWRFRYVKIIINKTDAINLAIQESSIYTYLSQLDLFFDSNNNLFGVVTPSYFGSPEGETVANSSVHFGCRVVPLNPLPSPTIAYQVGANVPVVLTATESDLFTGNNDGPAACSYDSLSTGSGMIITRRQQINSGSPFLVQLQSTKLLLSADVPPPTQKNMAYNTIPFKSIDHVIGVIVIIAAVVTLLL